MNKPQSLYLFLFLLCVTILAFTAAILAFRFKDSLTVPHLDIIAPVVMSVLAVVLLISIAHLVMQYRGTSVNLQDMPPRIAREDQMVLFVPFSGEQLSRLSLNNNIIDVKYNVVESGKRLIEPRKFVLDVTQSYGFCPTKKIQVVVNSDSKCQLLFTNEEIAQINEPGMYFVVSGNASIVKSNLQKLKLNIKYPEISDSNLSLSCEYQKICTGSMEDLLYILKSQNIQSGETVYEKLLSDIFVTCPNRKDQVVPDSTSVALSGKELWINTNSGRLALSLMKILGPEKTLIDLEDLKNKGSPLYNKIIWVKDYVANNVCHVSESSVGLIFNRAKGIFCRNIARISKYYCVHDDRVTTSGQKFSSVLAEAMRKDEKLLITMAIASYSCDGTANVDAEANYFIRGILALEPQKSDPVLKEVEELLGSNPYKTIDVNNIKFAGSKVCAVIKELVRGSTGCTVQSIINAARMSILEKQWDSVPVTRTMGYTMNIGYVQKICYYNRREVEVSTEEEVCSIVDDVASTSSTQNLILPGNVQ